MTAPQKALADRAAAGRSPGLSFGPVFKEPRTFFPLERRELSVLRVPA